MCFKCFENALDTDNIDINELFDNFGLFSNELVSTLIKNLIKEKFNKEDLMLKNFMKLNLSY